MARLQDYVQWKTETTEPTIIDKEVIRLESQSFSIQTPFGGYVWHRPTAVLVGQHGLTQRIPIQDITRNSLWTLTGIGFVTTSLIWLVSKLRREKV